VSFFDEVDQPPRARAGGRPSAAGRRRPSGTDPKFLVRRVVLLVAVVVAIILIVLGVHSCQVSARNSALRDYDNSVASLVQRSNQTGHSLFSELSGASGSTNQTGLQTQINQTRAQALSQLAQARGLSVPDQMQTAQHDLLLTLRMRSDAISTIAQEIQPALGKSTAGDAVARISAQMSRLYASDVLYNAYVAPAIAGVLRGASIPVGGANGQPISHSTFVPNSQWLSATFVAEKLGSATTPTATKNVKAAPGIHGHRMISVTANGTALQPSVTNSVAATPTPTFACTFANDGTDTETNVVVKVTVQGTSVTGQAIVPKTVPNHTYTAQVTLASSPPKGTYTVSATIERVPGETVTTHNTQTFQVSFH
jgi:hypothetical protein